MNKVENEKIVKIRLNDRRERDVIITLLAHNGYKVWIEDKSFGGMVTNFYVCFEIEKEEEVLIA